MSSRSYLSIGDVLTLLRQEFPDITISKIRFLESQGLVNPERTPSGYRKFYDHDVERLRWVLRQQREHFLPLKVIKDRLDEDASIIYANGDTPAGDGAEEREPVLAGRAAAEAATAGAPPAPPPPPAPHVAPVVATDDAPLPGIEEGVAAEPDPAPTGGVPSRRSTARNRTPDRTAPDDEARDGAATAPTTPSGASGTSGGPGGKASHGGTPAAPEPELRGPSPAASSAPSAPADEPATAVGPGEIRLSPEELAGASGLAVADVEALVEFGLLAPTVVAGLPTYDRHALDVARAAAAFARFGIEPRHLRLYKVAADREAGFIEQIVVPLVRQRNPDARVRAEATAAELAELGQRLRAALLEVVLGPTLRG